MHPIASGFLLLGVSVPVIFYLSDSFGSPKPETDKGMSSASSLNVQAQYLFIETPSSESVHGRISVRMMT